MYRVLKLLGFLALVVLFNWPYLYEEALSENLGIGPQLIPSSNGLTLPDEKPVPTFAGYPCKFYQASAPIGESPQASFNWLALLINVCFWSLVLASFVLYENFFLKAMTRKEVLEIDGLDTEPSSADNEPQKIVASKPKRRRLQLSDIFVATALTASVFGYWQMLRTRGELDRAFANEIVNQGGGVRRAAHLPFLARKMLEFGGLEANLRLTEVRLMNPDDAMLEKVVALPYLASLTIAGGEYDLRILDRLATKPLLTEFAIVGRQLDKETLALIRSMPSLRKLGLMRTNITAAGVAAIGQPKLLELNLVHTDVQLADLGTPVFSKTLRKLRLPHPRKGTGDSIHIEDWPELVELSCYEHDELLNSAPVAMTLKNLPKLSKVEVDALQLFELDFEQLPSLEKVEPMLLQWQQRATSKQVIPSLLWAGKLRMKDVPKLKEVSAFAGNLNSIDIVEESLTLRLGVFNKASELPGSYRVSSPRTASQSLRTVNGRLVAAETGFLTPNELPLPMRQKWINDIGSSAGLTSVNLESVPLEGVELTPLTSNRSIRGLKLDKTGVTNKQLVELKGLERIEVLSLVGSEVDGRIVEELVKALPSLRKVQCDQLSIQRLRLEHVPNLESLFETPTDSRPHLLSFYSTASPNRMDALRLVDVPKLNDGFVMLNPMKLLHIDLAPALSGLSFQAPLPGDAVIKGVRDLKFFAAGGPTCSDAIVSEVLNCEGLKRLTLAYTNLQPETLLRIATLRNLEQLVLLGTKTDDKFLESLEVLKKLRILILDQTKLTRTSIASVCKIKTLEELDLGDLRLSAEDVAELVAGLPKLKRLVLLGAELTADSMRQIAKLKELTSLDLSSCELSDELLNAFAESPPLELVELVLNSAKIGEVGFSNLLKKARNTRFSIKDTEINPELMDKLVMQNRLSEYDGLDGSVRIAVNRTIYSSAMGIGRNSRVGPPQPGDIDCRWFAPSFKARQ